MIELRGKKIILPNFLEMPLLLALAITLILFLLGQPSYETNDDMTIISLLSGKMGLEPAPDGIFMSLPLSWLLHALYGFADSVPWYGLIMYSFLFIGFYLSLKIIFQSQLQLSNKIFLSISQTIFYMHLFYELNFTAVSLFIWFMTMGYIAYLNLNDTPPRAIEAVIGIILGISYLIRPGIFGIALTFSIPIISAFLVPVARKRLVYLLLPFLLLATLSAGMEYLFHSNSEYAKYQQFNRVRSDFTDTEMSAFTSKTPAALNNAGWSYEDYALAANWWLHDETIYNTDKINAFLSANKMSELSLASRHLFAASIAKYYLYFLVLVLCCAAVLFNEPRNWKIPQARQALIRNLSRLLAVFFVAGIVILGGIRFPPRVAIPLFSFFILLAAVLGPVIYKGQILNKFAKRLFYIAAFPILVYLFFLFFTEIEETHARHKRMKEYTEQSFQEGLHLNGQNTVFVYATGSDSFEIQFANPFHEFRDMMEITVFPVGWLINSPAYNTFLRNHGFGTRENAVLKMINNRNVVFCFYQFYDGAFDEYSTTLLSHLQQHYSSFFPGHSFSFEGVLDRKIYNRGWVFFRIAANPTNKEWK